MSRNMMDSSPQDSARAVAALQSGFFVRWRRVRGRAARSASRCGELARHSWINIPLASKKPRMRYRSQPATSSRIGASTARTRWSLSTVRFTRSARRSDVSETAMVRPSRALMCSMNVNVGTAVTGIDHVIRTGDLLLEQTIEHRDLPIAGRSAHDGVDLSRRLVAKLRAENVIGRNNVFQCRDNDLDRSRRQPIKIKLVPVDARIASLVKQFDVPLEADSFADLAEMFFANFGLELGIMQQQVGQFRALLHQVDLGHPLGFAFEVLGGNADQFGEHVAGIVEGERLVKVARENVAF